jgi:hypothetical protein
MKKKLDICIYLCDNMRILNKKLNMKTISVKDYHSEIKRKLCAANITSDLKRNRKNSLARHFANRAAK